jgi:hypothetical protein
MKKCKCQDCGKSFNKGDEGDNEEYCLKCERQSLTRNMSQEDYEDFDRLETERDEQ